LPKITRDLSLMFTEMFANFCVPFFLFFIHGHKVIAVRCGSSSLGK
jgi:hypothetical protein